MITIFFFWRFMHMHACTSHLCVCTQLHTYTPYVLCKHFYSSKRCSLISFNPKTQFCRWFMDITFWSPWDYIFFEYDNDLLNRYIRSSHLVVSKWIHFKELFFYAMVCTQKLFLILNPMKIFAWRQFTLCQNRGLLEHTNVSFRNFLS